MIDKPHVFLGSVPLSIKSNCIQSFFITEIMLNINHSISQCVIHNPVSGRLKPWMTKTKGPVYCILFRDTMLFLTGPLWLILGKWSTSSWVSSSDCGLSRNRNTLTGLVLHNSYPTSIRMTDQDRGFSLHPIWQHNAISHRFSVTFPQKSRTYKQQRLKVEKSWREVKKTLTGLVLHTSDFTSLYP